jgi:uncharacterized protein YlxP (DUF503 family)
MIIGILVIEIFINSSCSLKEKRFVLKSIKDKLKNKFNVSVAELEYQDKWQRAEVGIALISNSQPHAEKSLQNIFRFLDKADTYEIISYQFDYI